VPPHAVLALCGTASYSSGGARGLGTLGMLGNGSSALGNVILRLQWPIHVLNAPSNSNNSLIVSASAAIFFDLSSQKARVWRLRLANTR